MRRALHIGAACAAAASLVALGGARTVGAVSDPTGTVTVTTGGNCPPTASSTVYVSTSGCSDGFVAVSGTGSAYGGVAVSGTGDARTDSDLTPVAVSGTGSASGCGDLGGYAVSATGDAYGCNGVAVAGNQAGNPGPQYGCQPNSDVNVSIFGTSCPSPVSISLLHPMVLRTF